MLEKWKLIWERKGADESNDLCYINGFENTNLDPKAVAAHIAEQLSLTSTDRILDVGCGSGLLAQHLQSDQYFSVDYALSMAQRFKTVIQCPCTVSEANSLAFKDKSFTKVFAFSIFQYFPDQNYAVQAIAELRRIATEAVFIGDLPFRSHSTSHLLFDRKTFKSWEITEGFYNPDRFNALWRVGRER